MKRYTCVLLVMAIPLHLYNTHEDGNMFSVLRDRLCILQIKVSDLFRVVISEEHMPCLH